MKKLTRIILLIAFLSYPSICISSHVIKLKNGNELIIYEYWEDGGQIRFYSHGGVVGVQKALVREIRKGDLTYVIEKPQPPKRWREHVVETKDKSASEHEKKTPLSDPGDKAFLEEKRLVMLRISAVSAAFREAKASNNRKQMEEERKKLLASQRELSRILNEVRNAHGGRVPNWWDEPLPGD